MKTKNIASLGFAKIAYVVMVILLISIALWTFFLALLGDTTALGDPYYQDTILAPARAFGPWALLMILITHTILTKIIVWWKNR